MAIPILQTNSYTWYMDNGNAKEYIPNGINVYWNSSGSVRYANVYKSACYVNTSNYNVQICLVSDESFGYSDAFGNWFNSVLDSNYYGGATGGWFNVGQLDNPTSIFPVFVNDEAGFLAYITDSTPIVTPITSNGGGATHIAKVSGKLSELSNNLSDILLVSGGGGGGLIIGEDTYAGADGGGISGSGDLSGNQSTGYAFGQGESATNQSGGGGGYYGGKKSNA